MIWMNEKSVMKMEHKDKLISFPKVVLDTLEEYKRKTGISASDYIRRALIKQMILDQLIWFQTKYVILEKESNGEALHLKELEAHQANSFCDGDKCEIPLT